MSSIEDRDAATSTGWIRLAIGFAQGLAAWLLIRPASQAFGAAQPELFAALSLVVAFPPLIVLAGLGRMRPVTLAIWTLGAAFVVMGLGAYDLWREPLENGFSARRHWPSPQLIFFAGAALYIGHHLIEPADVERRLFPGYRLRFESAWRHGFQLALSLAFTGVFWGTLALGAALFDMIGVKALSTLLRQEWFISPALAVAFAGAVHLTDVRPGLIRGVRTVGLTLLSWLLPLMAALTGAFLVALIFTGVSPLWKTKAASALLLSAAGVLILLVNAAYQDGEERDALPLLLRWTGRGAAILLAPLGVLAALSTSLRIGQYGLTPERIASVAIVLVGAFYALGYVWAAASRGPWLKRIEMVNVAGALVALVAILTLLSPLADPARLATADQTTRLLTHRTPVDKFDFKFLRFGAGRFGREALARLASNRDPAIAAAAKRAQALTNQFDSTGTAAAPLSHAKVWPNGAALPDSFRRQGFAEVQAWGADACLNDGTACDLIVRDLNGDGRSEVLVASQLQMVAVYAQADDGRWAHVGNYALQNCASALDALRSGGGGIVPPSFGDLEVGGARLSFSRTSTSCPAAQKPAGKPTPPVDRPPSELGPAFQR